MNVGLIIVKKSIRILLVEIILGQDFVLADELTRKGNVSAIIDIIVVKVLLGKSFLLFHLLIMAELLFESSNHF